MNKEFEQKLKQTLKFYLDRLPDEESRDFMIKLILRDCKEEIRSVIDSFYYGEDLLDPEIMQHYQELLLILKEEVR